MGGDLLTNNDRKKLDALLTIDVHMRDIVEGFVRDNIIDAVEFEWESQLRFKSIMHYIYYLYVMRVVLLYIYIYIYARHLLNLDFTGYMILTICG